MSDPVGIPLSPLYQTAGKATWRMSPATAIAIRDQKRREAVEYQRCNTESVEDYTIRPAIGATGGAKNVGWELLPPPKGHGPTWYFATRGLCLAAIPRHRDAYA